MLTKWIRTPRSMMILLVAAVNLLSVAIGLGIAELVLNQRKTDQLHLTALSVHPLIMIL